ncbi:MAG: ABC transporter ATP-binding protein [Defluviitaleaceae bacterium]|nr:ABC transporter ATP-binding protein [Defluviitaleaceae bacterium]
MASITVDKILRTFENGFTILEDFTQVFEDGGFVTLLGPSGCGKTTLLRLIAGFDKPTRGEIRIGDVVVCSDKKFVPPEKRNIGMVFQSYAVWPHMTVFQNVAYPLKIKKFSKAVIKEKVDKVLESVHLIQYADRTPAQLSGGQQQRVALARALVAEPELLLLDEPLSNLDAKLRETMRFEIKELQKTYNITVVYVTHDQTEAMAMSDKVIVMNQGLVQQVGTPMEIYKNPANQFVAAFVGKVNFMKGEVKDGRIDLTELGQSVPYDGSRTGKVVVAVRPENISMSLEPEAERLEGTLTSMYYLGDTNDCRVEMGGQTLRVIAEGNTHDAFETPSKVYMNFRDILVYEDDGTDHAEIVT